MPKYDKSTCMCSIYTEVYQYNFSGDNANDSKSRKKIKNIQTPQTKSMFLLFLLEEYEIFSADLWQTILPTSYMYFHSCFLLSCYFHFNCLHLWNAWTKDIASIFEARRKPWLHCLHRMMERNHSSYKELKEQFVSGHNGSPASEITLIYFGIACCVFLHNAFAIRCRNLW